MAGAFGPNLGGYGNFWIAYYGAVQMAGWDFSFWNLASPSVAAWFVNGSDIGPSYASSFNQAYLPLAQIGTATARPGHGGS
jgi:hypothetical protein